MPARLTYRPEIQKHAPVGDWILWYSPASPITVTRSPLLSRSCRVKKLSLRSTPAARTQTLSPVTVPIFVTGSTVTYCLLMTLKHPGAGRIFSQSSSLSTTVTFAGAESLVQGYAPSPPGPLRT